MNEYLVDLEMILNVLRKRKKIFFVLFSIYLILGLSLAFLYKDYGTANARGYSEVIPLFSFEDFKGVDSLRALSLKTESILLPAEKSLFKCIEFLQEEKTLTGRQKGELQALRNSLEKYHKNELNPLAVFLEKNSEVTAKDLQDMIFYLCKGRGTLIPVNYNDVIQAVNEIENDFLTLSSTQQQKIRNIKTGLNNFKGAVNGMNSIIKQINFTIDLLAKENHLGIEFRSNSEHLLYIRHLWRTAEKTETIGLLSIFSIVVAFGISLFYTISLEAELQSSQDLRYS